MLTIVLEAAAATRATVVGSDPVPLVELVAVQRASVAVAPARGRDPNFARHPIRSVAN